MRIRILHHDRRWGRPDNHLNGRICPICYATVHGSQSQHGHTDWHIELVRMAELIEQVAGIGQREDGPPVPWTPAVDELEAPEPAT